MAKLITGQPALPFTLEDLDGKPVSLADFTGRVTLVNFWSAECPVTARTDGVLAQAVRARGWQERVALLLVAANANEPPDLLRRVAAERGWTCVLRDPAHAVADGYGAETTPHCFVVDAEGILRYQGGFDDVSFRQRTPTRAYVIEAIAALLANQPVPLSATPPYGCAIIRFSED